MSRASSGHWPYGALAPFYDLLSGEPVYRAGRRAAVEALGLRPGEHVLDLGCGTGLNLPLLRAGVGPAGQVTGVDLSPAMLSVARRRARRHGWDNTSWVVADATRLAPADVPGAPVDVLLATYALSLLPDVEEAWRRATALVRPGGRVGIVDLQRPTGRARWATPAARAACALGGSDIDAHPWTLLERDARQVHARSLRGGHVQVRTGTLV